jgi:hypothetical protein
MMFSFLTIGAAWFAFGYCVTDIIQNARSAKRIDEMLRSTIENNKKN